MKPTVKEIQKNIEFLKKCINEGFVNIVLEEKKAKLTEKR